MCARRRPTTATAAAVIVTAIAGSVTTATAPCKLFVVALCLAEQAILWLRPIQYRETQGARSLGSLWFLGNTTGKR